MNFSKPATTAAQIRAPSFCANSIEGGRFANAKSKPPKLARPRSADEANRAIFERKFANSYRASVSSPGSYRRKRIPRSKDKFADAEKEMLRNIQECRRALAEHNERLQSQDKLVNVPALRAVRNLILLDNFKALQAAMKTWKQFATERRQAEQRRRAAKSSCRTMAEYMVQDCIEIASKSVSTSTTPNKNEPIENGMNTSRIQRWYQSQSMYGMTRLDSNSGDGRISYFDLPAPDLTRCTNSRNENPHRQQTQQSDKEKSTKYNVKGLRRSVPSRKKSYRLSSELFVASLPRVPENKANLIDDLVNTRTSIKNVPDEAITKRWTAL